ncbi:MAG: SGNH/GDSL hydrolase family protein [Sedimentisphaerales bacterium]|nr:SGNH/GDSL hydrolase family protein [Sedimentisphaerales bacterium]
MMNLSKADATVESAIKQTELLGNENAIVLLEIGGNNILGSTPIQFFEKSLQNLLENITTQNRIIIMFELPVLPWQVDYILIQRKLSKKYDAILIPRCYLVKVLAAKDATLDSIHLSPKGHQIMAETIWEIIRDSIPPKPESNRENLE